MIEYIKERAFPTFLQEYAPQLIDFFGQYVDWMNENENVSYIIDHLSSESDIDESVNAFSSSIKEKLLYSFPEFKDNLDEMYNADLKLLLKQIFYLYNAKSSIDAYKALFRAVFNADVKIGYPRDYVLKLSDGRRKNNTVIRIAGEDASGTGGNLYSNDYKGYLITGTSSKANAYINSISSYEYLIYENSEILHDVQKQQGYATNITNAIYTFKNPTDVLDTSGLATAYENFENASLEESKRKYTLIKHLYNNISGNTTQYDTDSGDLTKILEAIKKDGLDFSLIQNSIAKVKTDFIDYQYETVLKDYSLYPSLLQSEWKYVVDVDSSYTNKIYNAINDKEVEQTNQKFIVYNVDNLNSKFFDVASINKDSVVKNRVVEIISSYKNGDLYISSDYTRNEFDITVKQNDDGTYRIDLSDYDYLIAGLQEMFYLDAEGTYYITDNKEYDLILSDTDGYYIQKYFTNDLTKEYVKIDNLEQWLRDYCADICLDITTALDEYCKESYITKKVKDCHDAGQKYIQKEYRTASSVVTTSEDDREYIYYYATIDANNQICGTSEGGVKTYLKVTMVPKSVFEVENQDASFISNGYVFNPETNVVSSTATGEKIKLTNPEKENDVLSPNDAIVQFQQEKENEFSVYLTETGETFFVPSENNWENGEVKGYLDSSMLIQDGYKYQNFSYDIESDVNISKWRKIVNTLLHPAGFKYFSSLNPEVEDGDTYPPQYYINPSWSDDAILQPDTSGVIYDNDGYIVKITRRANLEEIYLGTLKDSSSTDYITSKNYHTKNAEYDTIHLMNKNSVKYVYDINNVFPAGKDFFVATHEKDGVISYYILISDDGTENPQVMKFTDNVASIVDFTDGELEKISMACSVENATYSNLFYQANYDGEIYPVICVSSNATEETLLYFRVADDKLEPIENFSDYVYYTKESNLYVSTSGTKFFTVGGYTYILNGNIFYRYNGTNGDITLKNYTYSEIYNHFAYNNYIEKITLRDKESKELIKEYTNPVDIHKYLMSQQNTFEELLKKEKKYPFDEHGIVTEKNHTYVYNTTMTSDNRYTYERDTYSGTTAISGTIVSGTDIETSKPYVYGIINECTIQNGTYSTTFSGTVNLLDKDIIIVTNTSVVTSGDVTTTTINECITGTKVYGELSGVVKNNQKITGTISGNIIGDVSETVTATSIKGNINGIIEHSVFKDTIVNGNFIASFSSATSGTISGTAYSFEHLTLEGNKDKNKEFFGFLKVMNVFLNHAYNEKMKVEAKNVATYKVNEDDETEKTFITSRIKQLNKAQNHSETPEMVDLQKRNLNSTLIFHDDGSLVSPRIIDFKNFRLYDDMKTTLLTLFKLNSEEDLIQDVINGNEYFGKIFERFLFFVGAHNNKGNKFLKNLNLLSLYTGYYEYLKSNMLTKSIENLYYYSSTFKDYDQIFTTTYKTLVDNKIEVEYVPRNTMLDYLSSIVQEISYQMDIPVDNYKYEDAFLQFFEDFKNKKVKIASGTVKTTKNELDYSYKVTDGSIDLINNTGTIELTDIQNQLVLGTYTVSLNNISYSYYGHDGKIMTKKVDGETVIKELSEINVYDISKLSFNNTSLIIGSGTAVCTGSLDVFYYANQEIPEDMNPLYCSNGMFYYYHTNTDDSTEKIYVEPHYINGLSDEGNLLYFFVHETTLELSFVEEGIFSFYDSAEKQCFIDIDEDGNYFIRAFTKITVSLFVNEIQYQKDTSFDLSTNYRYQVKVYQDNGKYYGQVLIIFIPQKYTEAYNVYGNRKFVDDSENTYYPIWISNPRLKDTTDDFYYLIPYIDADGNYYVRNNKDAVVYLKTIITTVKSQQYSRYYIKTSEGDKIKIFKNEANRYYLVPNGSDEPVYFNYDYEMAYYTIYNDFKEYLKYNTLYTYTLDDMEVYENDGDYYYADGTKIDDRLTENIKTTETLETYYFLNDEEVLKKDDGYYYTDETTKVSETLVDDIIESYYKFFDDENGYYRPVYLNTEGYYYIINETKIYMQEEYSTYYYLASKSNNKYPVTENKLRVYRDINNKYFVYAQDYNLKDFVEDTWYGFFKEDAENGKYILNTLTVTYSSGKYYIDGTIQCIRNGSEFLVTKDVYSSFSKNYKKNFVKYDSSYYAIKKDQYCFIEEDANYNYFLTTTYIDIDDEDIENSTFTDDKGNVYSITNNRLFPSRAENYNRYYIIFNGTKLNLKYYLDEDTHSDDAVDTFVNYYDERNDFITFFYDEIEKKYFIEDDTLGNTYYLTQNVLGENSFFNTEGRELFLFDEYVKNYFLGDNENKVSKVLKHYLYTSRIIKESTKLDFTYSYGVKMFKDLSKNDFIRTDIEKENSFDNNSMLKIPDEFVQVKTKRADYDIFANIYQSGMKVSSFYTGYTVISVETGVSAILGEKYLINGDSLFLLTNLSGDFSEDEEVILVSGTTSGTGIETKETNFTISNITQEPNTILTNVNQYYYLENNYPEDEEVYIYTYDEDDFYGRLTIEKNSNDVKLYSTIGTSDALTNSVLEKETYEVYGTSNPTEIEYFKYNVSYYEIQNNTIEYNEEIETFIFNDIVYSENTNGNCVKSLSETGTSYIQFSELESASGTMIIDGTQVSEVYYDKINKTYYFKLESTTGTYERYNALYENNTFYVTKTTQKFYYKQTNVYTPTVFGSGFTEGYIFVDDEPLKVRNYDNKSQRLEFIDKLSEIYKKRKDEENYCLVKRKNSCIINYTLNEEIDNFTISVSGTIPLKQIMVYQDGLLFEKYTISGRNIILPLSKKETTFEIYIMNYNQTDTSKTKYVNKYYVKFPTTNVEFRSSVNTVYDEGVYVSVKYDVDEANIMKPCFVFDNYGTEYGYFPFDKEFYILNLYSKTSDTPTYDYVATEYEIVNLGGFLDNIAEKNRKMPIAIKENRRFLKEAGRTKETHKFNLKRNYEFEYLNDTPNNYLYFTVNGELINPTKINSQNKLNVYSDFSGYLSIPTISFYKKSDFANFYNTNVNNGFTFTKLTNGCSYSTNNFYYNTVENIAKHIIFFHNNKKVIPSEIKINNAITTFIFDGNFIPEETGDSLVSKKLLKENDLVLTQTNKDFNFKKIENAFYKTFSDIKSNENYFVYTYSGIKMLKNAQTLFVQEKTNNTVYNVITDKNKVTDTDIILVPKQTTIDTTTSLEVSIEEDFENYSLFANTKYMLFSDVQDTEYTCLENQVITKKFLDAFKKFATNKIISFNNEKYILDDINNITNESYILVITDNNIVTNSLYEPLLVKYAGLNENSYVYSENSFCLLGECDSVFVRSEKCNYIVLQNCPEIYDYQTFSKESKETKCTYNITDNFKYDEKVFIVFLDGKLTRNFTKEGKKLIIPYDNSTTAEVYCLSYPMFVQAAYDQTTNIITITKKQYATFTKNFYYKTNVSREPLSEVSLCSLGNTILFTENGKWINSTEINGSLLNYPRTGKQLAYLSFYKPMIISNFFRTSEDGDAVYEDGQYRIKKYISNEFLFFKNNHKVLKKNVLEYTKNDDVWFNVSDTEAEASTILIKKSNVLPSDMVLTENGTFVQYSEFTGSKVYSEYGLRELNNSEYITMQDTTPNNIMIAECPEVIYYNLIEKNGDTFIGEYTHNENNKFYINVNYASYVKKEHFAIFINGLLITNHSLEGTQLVVPYNSETTTIEIYQMSYPVLTTVKYDSRKNIVVMKDIIKNNFISNFKVLPLNKVLEQ